MSDKHIPAELRRLVKTRAGGCCEYCRSQAKYSADSFTVDHITPRSLGGATEADNLAHSCFGCNQHKAARREAADPATGSIEPLFNPRKQDWEGHFAWSDDFTLIVGLTPTGRATVEALQINRTGLVNLRRAPYSIGEHPPKIVTGQ